MEVAIKEFLTTAGKMEEDENLKEELSSWDIFLNGSREGRMMHQLQHPHVLGLVGLAFQPLRLLLELAPLGDLKACIKPFVAANAKLSITTLKAIMYQVLCVPCNGGMYTAFCNMYLYDIMYGT